MKTLPAQTFRICAALLLCLLAASPAHAQALSSWVPLPLLRMGPFGMRLWQWGGLPVLLLAGLAVGNVAARLLVGTLRSISHRAGIDWSAERSRHARGPFTLWLGATAAGVALGVLELPEPAHIWVDKALSVLGALGLFWAAFRALDVGAAALIDSKFLAESAESRALVPIGKRILKVVVALLGVGTALSLMGLPVASVVAGLGVGGLAVALAAQKLFENLLGAFVLGVDQPFKEGDFVKVDGVMGNVERVGLRSTGIRTLDRTLVTIPNGQLAERLIESYAARDRIRLNAVVGLTYSTTSEQMQKVMQGLKDVMKAHPRVWPEGAVTRFVGFGQSSLDVEVIAWFTTTDFGEFSDIRTEIYMGFMRVVEEAGASFAFPTRTLHLESVPASVGAGRTPGQDGARAG